MKTRIFLSFVLLLFGITQAMAQTTAFTYQGKLTDGGSAPNGNYDLTFQLFDTSTVGSGAQLGATLNLNSVPVSSGVFTVQLDFGACPSCFNGANRFLEIAVRPSAQGPKQDPPLPVSVELSPGAAADPGLAEAIRQRLREILVVQTSIELVSSGTLERSEYKSSLVQR